MSTVIGILLLSVFFLLGAIHIYWFLGGQKGLLQVIPRREELDEIISPPKIACLIVACILFSISFFHYAITFKSSWIRAEYKDVTLYILAILFLLRFIGDFRFVGIAKKIKRTEFAKWDSYFYSPLCLLLAVLMFSLSS